MSDYASIEYSPKTMSALEEGDIESAMACWRRESGEHLSVDECDVVDITTAVQELADATSRQD